MKNIYNLIGKGKIKRYLSARNKIIYSGGVYHVTHRAPGRELIFVEAEDYLYLLTLLKKISKEFLWDVFAFVLMSNHFHILLRITDANLSEGMKKICERYAVFFNKKYERKGSVFSRPYRAALCMDDIYLLTISLYIHLNPIKAGLSKVIAGYRWSSLNVYIRNRKSFIRPNLILNILSSDINIAKQQYRKLLLKSKNIKHKNVIEEPTYVNYFREKLKTIMKNIGISVDELEDQIEIFKIKKESKSKKPESLLAKKYLIDQLLARGYRINEIAKKLEISRITIYNIRNSNINKTSVT